MFCNGSKEQPYIDAILDFRQAGFANLVPFIDDPDDWQYAAALKQLAGGEVNLRPLKPRLATLKSTLGLLAPSG